MSIERTEYEACLQGFSFTDCVVRDRSRFTFVATRVLTDAEAAEEARQMLDPSFREKRVLPFLRAQPPGKRWSFSTLNNWDLVRGGASLVPQNQFVGVDLQGRVYVVGSGVAGQEADVPPFRNGGPDRGGLRKLKTIGGSVYVCGGARSVGKRLGKDRWASFTQAMPAHPEVGRGGFQDIDGFAEDDIYAVGGRADVFRFDGATWRAVAVPTDTWLESVCCAGDGQVYIGGADGLLLSGRGERWKVVSTKDVRLGFRDLVWYEDRLWGTNDHGLWTYHDGALERPDLPPEIAICAGHLYANDGVLLTAGLGGAAFREGGQWHSLVDRPAMEKALRDAKAQG